MKHGMTINLEETAVKTRLKRFVILGLIGLGSKALRKRIQQRRYQPRLTR
jgi:hypothetical protein